MRCEESADLIGAAIEGHVSAAPLSRLVRHLERCGDCGGEAAAQLAIKRLLAARPQEPLPEGFARRLAERLSGEAFQLPASPLGRRRIAAAILCTAAALLAVALVSARIAGGGRDDLAAAVAAFGHGAAIDQAFDAPPHDRSAPQELGLLLITAVDRGDDGR